jgi:uroporphyrinogen III methyltransferase/synthase
LRVKPLLRCLRAGLTACSRSEDEHLAASDTRTLAGRRIVITRAPEQSVELAQTLRGLGAEVLSLPMVHFTGPPQSSELDAAIEALEEFDWLLFTSANAVRFFLARCRQLERWPPATLRLAVVGPATRDALETEGLLAAVAPREFRGEALAAELAGEVAGRRVLLPRSDQAGDELPRLLHAAGAFVTEVVAYSTEPPDSLDFAALEMLRRGDADAITFFSPSAFRHFVESFGPDALRRLTARVALAAVGPVTAAAIREAGLPVAVEAAQATTPALVEALERHFHLPAAGKAPRK